MKIVCSCCGGKSFRLATNDTGAVPVICLTCEKQSIVETPIDPFDRELDDLAVPIFGLHLDPQPRAFAEAA